MDKKIIKRMMKFLAFFIVVMGISYIGPVKTEAMGMSLADLQAKFPNGKYWNHATQSGHDYNEATLAHSGNCNNPDGYTDYPCTGHTLDIQGEGYYDCNTYGGALQCCGFAYKLADDAYGSMPNSWGMTSIDNAKVGDVIHFNTGDAWGHWAMIIGRNGTTVTLGECNYDFHCGISWGRQCDLSNQSYTIYSAPAELQMGSATVQPEPDNKYTVIDNGDNTVRITTFYGLSGDIVIPSEINGKKVTAVGAAAFRNKRNIKSVVIPDGVVSIGEEAFRDCEDLAGVTIPESVTEIGARAFYSCDQLESIMIPSSVQNMGKGAFKQCVNLIGAVILNGAVIGEEAFKDCANLKAVTIEDGVKEVGRGSFYGCVNLSDITIPGSITEIGVFAFCDCSGLTDMVLQNGVEYIGYGAFADCVSLREAVFPDSVKQIENGAFAGCSGLNRLALPKGVKLGGNWIGDERLELGAFVYCSGLTHLTIPDGAKMETRSFFGCSSLKSIAVSKGVTREGIWGGGFEGCDNLVCIEVDPDNRELDSRRNCNGVIETKSNTLLMGCKTTQIPESVQIIGGDAFYGCTGLTSVTIPGNVERIGWSAFEGCSGLTGVTIPGNVKEIGWSAFEGCSSLANVKMQRGVLEIGPEAFLNCNLRSIEIPDSVKYISGEAFGYKGHTDEDGEDVYEKIPGFLIYGVSGSYAERYAKENGFTFWLISSGASGNESQGGNPPASCPHSYQASIIPATAKMDGSIVEKCIKCGNEKSRTVIYAAGIISLSKTSYTYSGKTRRPAVTVKDRMGKTLKNNVDYTVSFPKKAKDVGRYALTVTFRGKYSGTVKRTFEIIPKGTSITKVSAVKKGFTVKWKNQGKQTSGYEIAYSTDKGFTKKATKKVLAKSGTASKSVLKQKAKKKYYVRIRTYKTVRMDGKSVKVYSGWSKVKTVTTKK